LRLEYIAHNFKEFVMEIFIISWLIFAVVVGVAANARGRSGFGWFLVALLISPLVALVLVLVMKKIEPPVVQPKAPTDERPCPFCAEAIKKAAIKCRHCGSEVPAIIEEIAGKELFFERPNGMPMGEYYEVLSAKYDITQSGSGYAWKGMQYPNMTAAIAAIQQACA
jgi:hypothetical protein